MEVPSFKPIQPKELYKVLTKQAAGGEGEEAWLDMFELRPEGYDPLHQDLLNPQKVFFQKTAETNVEDLRDTIFNFARPIFIEDEPWDNLIGTFYDIYTNPSVQEFTEQRAANIFFGLLHSQVFDIVVAAAASLRARRQLPEDNIFAYPADPAHNQIVIANRVLTVVEHRLFKELTGGLPVLEGLMEPLADVMTTVAVSGSGLITRAALGERLKPTSRRTVAETSTMLTKGNKIIFFAPSGNPSHVVQDKEGKTVRIIDNVEKGTVRMITSHNQGPASQHKNLYVGMSLDCSPLDLTTPPRTGLATTPELYIPRNHRHLEWLMQHTVELGNLHKRGEDLAGFGYNRGELSAKERHHLGNIALGKY